MIVSQAVLDDKFNISEEHGLNYLLDNAEYEEEIDIILELLRNCNNCNERYIKMRNNLINTIERK